MSQFCPTTSYRFTFSLKTSLHYLGIETLVFDRGMVSDDNLKHLELKKYKYITALDKNQIPNLQNINIERFESINEENMTGQILKMGFKKYDDTTYYEKLGTVDGRRYVMIFNPEMLIGQRKSRKDLI
ncbi:MAG: hypothetical protein C5S41_00475 [Candidatus Methanomarinus sp.]|nr:hypothetical protein C5S42_09550 [ANME-2 cluster archaeon]KAF5428216.1 MAG: hypothetical protein C5S41_00475 [ANME-2 cluster archaeon]